MPRSSVFAVVLAWSLSFAAGCASEGPDAVTPGTTPVGGCDGALTVEASAPSPHVPVGSLVDWTNDPPTTGPHYPLWAAWDQHYTALPRGHYVHNAEHGGVILLYRCDAGCPDVVEALLATARGMPADAACAAPVTKRVIVTSDPLLPDGVQVAAVAWQHAYTASCVDPYLDTFVRDHYANAPEDLCVAGANLGGTPLAP